MRHPKEDNFDKVIRDYCAEVDGKPMCVQTEVVKAIIATNNPEWRTNFADPVRGQYGITGIPIYLAQGIDRTITPERLKSDAEYCIKLTVLAIRTLLIARLQLKDLNTGALYTHNGGDGYAAAIFRAFGCQFGTSTWCDAKPNYLYFCNQTKQPETYHPAEMISGLR